MKSIRIGKRLVLELSIALMVMAGAAFAGDISVQLSADRTTVALGDEIQLQVTVQGVQQSNEPDVQNLGAFEVESSGSSSQVQIINGSTSAQVVFSYALTAKQNGTFQVGPARVIVGKKTYQSGTLSLQVSKGAAPAVAANAPFRVEAQVDSRNPYVDQQIVYTFRFLSRAQMLNAQLALPDFQGFWKEQLGKQKQSQQIISGVAWDVVEIRFALFPNSSGPITIGPTALGGDAAMPRQRRADNPFDDFFQDPFFFHGETKHIRLHTQPITLNVRRLPAAGKPADFSGLVGGFSLSGSLSKSKLAVGDSTTFSLRVEGQGNIRDVRLPAAEWKGFQTYDDQPAVDAHEVAGKWGGSKTFKKALVPLQAGMLAVPSFHLSYFNPQSNRYEVAASPALTLDVSAGSGQQTLAHVTAQPTGNGQADIKVQGEDLMPIKRELNGAGEPLDASTRRILWLVDLGSPILALLGLFARRRRERLLGDAGYRRRERALRAFQSGIRKWAADGRSYETASSLLRGYLGDKLNFDGQALTAIDVERKLHPVGVSEGTIRAVADFLNRCESAQYGGESVTEPGAAELRERLLQLAKQLEREISA